MRGYLTSFININQPLNQSMQKNWPTNISSPNSLKQSNHIKALSKKYPYK